MPLVIMIAASSSRSSSTTVAKDAAMHTAPDPRTDRLEHRRTATSPSERFSPDEHEGSRERRAGIGMAIPITAEVPRIERVRVQPDAAAPMLTP
jgi:hypothetical protein